MEPGQLLLAVFVVVVVDDVESGVHQLQIFWRVLELSWLLWCPIQHKYSHLDGLIRKFQMELLVVCVKAEERQGN